MNLVFYISGIIAVVSTLVVIVHLNAVHALLYLIVSLLSVGMMFFAMGAPFVAVLEIIIYAGAIMVLFLFVIMTLNLGPHAMDQEREWLKPTAWIGPSFMTLILVGLFVATLLPLGQEPTRAASIDPKTVARSLFTTYVLGIELASLLLLAGLVGAYHLGRPKKDKHRVGEIL